MEKELKSIIRALGEDPAREGLRKTPARAAKALAFLTQGYKAKLDDIVNGAIYKTRNDEMVIVRDIELFSLCEHHLLPFIGQAHVGYIPGPSGHVTGLSKLARLVDGYARRLQVQERLTTQIASAMERALAPTGVIVVLEAEHLCMSIRGVAKPGAMTVTSAVRGQFRSDARARGEAMALNRHPGAGR